MSACNKRGRIGGSDHWGGAASRPSVRHSRRRLRVQAKALGDVPVSTPVLPLDLAALQPHGPWLRPALLYHWEVSGSRG